MVIGIALIVVCCIIALIWIMSEVRKIKHKVWAFALIALIIFGYISFAVTTKDQGVDYTSFSGIMKAFKIYFSWIGSLFGNFKTLTTNAVKMDWGVNSNSTG
jgi:hypothetical protein